MTIHEILAAIDPIARRAPGALALIGAFARNAWAPPRATTDLDLAVAADAARLAELDHVLSSLGFRCVRRQQVEASDELPDILVFRRDVGDLRQIDLLIAKSPFEVSALSRAVPVGVGTEMIPVVTVEDLIIYKLLADRARDREDIRAVLATQERAGRAIDWGYLERWSAFWGLEERLARLH